jgi:hypothetical protein
VKLSDLALAGPSAEEPEEGDAEDLGEGMFEEAAMEAFEMFSAGKKEAAVSALKGAIEACIADYQSED